ncbi:MAG: phenylacetate-CoA oxygenase subunit PaaC [Arenicella sp.]|nr:phenylacetate-CoA oxygenase subunit PaaC [Arenicella sp.]
MNNDLYTYTLRQADNAMILCQRLCQWAAKAPELEEDIALTNIGLDMIGQARSLYQYAAELSDKDISEDDLAFMRDERQWRNLLLVEQPSGNFADTIARQYFYDVWHLAFLQELVNCNDEMLAAIATKSVKEAQYHVRHSSNWVKRLGDGTELSHERMQEAVNEMWQFTPEMFESDEVDQRLLAKGHAADLSKVKVIWDTAVTALLEEATLIKPDEAFLMSGGRQGIHTQHLGYILAEMQILPRSMPGCKW